MTDVNVDQVVAELEAHLIEQRAVLDSILEALIADAENEELLQVKEEIEEGIQQAETSLLDLKRAQLLGLVDTYEQSVLAVDQEQIRQNNAEDVDGINEDDLDDEEEEEGASDEEEDDLAYGRLTFALSEATASFAMAAEAGPQTETQTFANWETHTRGIGSKLLARMGYRAGQGLGTNNQGTSVPVIVTVTKPKAGLGSASEKKGAKRRKRGGERSRRRKYAEQQRAAREQRKDDRQKEELAQEGPALFSFINRAVAERITSQPSTSHGSGNKAGPRPSAVDRKSLVSQQDTITSIRQQLRGLQDMAARNGDNKTLMVQINSRIAEAQRSLQTAQQQHSTSQHQLHQKEQNKKWMKF